MPSHYSCLVLLLCHFGLMLCFALSGVKNLSKEFEDTKRVIRIRISKKNRQHNGQTKKYKRTNNDLQNILIKLKRSSITNLTKNRG